MEVRKHCPNIFNVQKISSQNVAETETKRVSCRYQHYKELNI